LCAALTLALVGSASGHDLKGVVVEQRQVLAQTGAEQSSAALNAATIQRVSATTKLPPGVLRSVFARSTLWPSGHRLSVCFLGGNQALRSRIVTTIKRKWPLAALTSRRLDYDSSFTTAPLCSDPPVADIKISFLTGSDFGGYWSYVGVESLKYAPSLNLEAFTANSPAEPKFSRLVAHEMGHALGLDHEHQSPGAPACKWDFVAIKKNYQWSSVKDMHDNLDRLAQSLKAGVPKYEFSQYDPLSVMHYYFPADNFIDGTGDPCFIPGDNPTPSKQDLKSLAAAYGIQLKDAEVLALRHSDEISKSLGAKYASLRSLLQVKKATLSSQSNKQILQQLSTKN
jgi:hypothetical protein